MELFGVLLSVVVGLLLPAVWRFFDPLVNRETMRLMVEHLPDAVTEQLSLPSFLKLLENLCCNLLSQFRLSLGSVRMIPSLYKQCCAEACARAPASVHSTSIWFEPRELDQALQGQDIYVPAEMRL